MNARWLAMILVASCLPATATAKKSERMHLFDLYNHESHNEIFSAAKVECTLCHAGEKSFSRAAVNPQCHHCHNNPKAPAPAEQDCARCHNEQLQPIRPHSHTAAWQHVHATIAKQDGRACATCHTINFCVDCHHQRDTVRQTMHPRNFRFVHSIEARANPARCDRCHTVDFCAACHQRQRIP